MQPLPFAPHPAESSLLGAGNLPASLPEMSMSATHSYCSLSAVYLSNNSISGTLPALWGSYYVGWGFFLESLYLDNNQLTGNLPQLWSDGGSLWGLGRLDLFNNQLTGPLSWTSKGMPRLTELLLMPGD